MMTAFFLLTTTFAAQPSEASATPADRPHAAITLCAYRFRGPAPRRSPKVDRRDPWRFPSGRSDPWRIVPPHRNPRPGRRGA